MEEEEILKNKPMVRFFKITTSGKIPFTSSIEDLTDSFSHANRRQIAGAVPVGEVNSMNDFEAQIGCSMIY